MGLEITALEGEPVGALVTGWEPEEPLSAEDEATIRRGLIDHLVLVFRGQNQPSDDALVGFAERFGDLILGSEWFRDVGDRPEILPVTNEVGDDGIPKGTGGATPLEWHADYSYVQKPGKESFLSSRPTRPAPTSAASTRRSARSRRRPSSACAVSAPFTRSPGT